VGIDTSSSFKDLVLQSQELERSEDDEGVDSDGIFEDIENDDFSLSDDEPKIKKRIKRKGKSAVVFPFPTGSQLLYLRFQPEVSCCTSVSDQHF
jgi:hypothetical protein